MAHPPARRRCPAGSLCGFGMAYACARSTRARDCCTRARMCSVHLHSGFPMPSNRSNARIPTTSRSVLHLPYFSGSRQRSRATSCLSLSDSRCFRAAFRMAAGVSGLSVGFIIVSALGLCASGLLSTEAATGGLRRNAFQTARALASVRIPDGVNSERRRDDQNSNQEDRAPHSVHFHPLFVLLSSISSRRFGR